VYDPDLHLFVDESEISLRQHVDRLVHPVRRESLGPVLSPNGEDEGTAIGYATAVCDHEDGMLKLWYMCHCDSVVRLAVSRDGLEWERRGRAVAEDARIDNLALTTVGPEADGWFAGAELAGYGYCSGPRDDPDAFRGLHLLHSRDGEHLEVRRPCILDGVGDRSSLMYDDEEGEYWLISRPSGRTAGFRPGELKRVRVANLWKSRDLVHWQDHGVVLKYDEHDPADLEIYGMQPFRYGRGFLALVEVYHRVVERLDSQLAWSPDGLHWQRVGRREAVIPLGGEGSWDSHWTVSTNNPPFLRGGRLQILYTGAGTKHASKNRHRRAIGLASVRKDGWVSMEAGRTEGVLVTVPLPLEKPTELELNVDCHSGYISAEVMHGEPGREAEPVAGYEGAASRVEMIDVTAHRVCWGQRKVVEPVSEGRCTLRFSMEQASFFSYRWSEADG
jgi:hypothetical protein